MSFCIPIKEALRYDKSVVGQRAMTFAISENSIEMPFSMLITSEVFDEFVKHNQLKAEIDWFKNTKTTKEKVESFERLYISIANAQFPPKVVDSLRECYELVCIDTNNLNNLSMKSSNALIALRRSTNFDDRYNLTSPVVFTKETFKQFIESLKKIYVSAFTPSAVLSENPNVSIIVSRVPNFKSIIEVECDLTGDSIFVKSYMGFPDSKNKVEKNNYEVGLDFLKIQNSSIDYQTKAIVFNSTENKLEIKEFKEKKQVNSISDQMILESCRLTKIIAKTTNASLVKAEFFTKDDEIYCTDIFTDYSKKPFDLSKEGIIEREIMIQTIENYSEENENNEEKVFNIDEVVNENNNNNYDENKKSDNDAQIDDDSINNLIYSLKYFIEKNKSNEDKDKYMELILQINKENKESIIEALEFCRKIIEKNN